MNQSVQGTDKVDAIINCHLAANRIGRPRMGPFSLTRQPNAMAGREVGGMANQLAARQFWLFQGQINDPLSNVVRNTVPHTPWLGTTVLQRFHTADQISIVPALECGAGNAEFI